MTDAPPEPTAPLIYAQMGKVLADLPAVPKSERNSQQGYAVQGIDDIVDALHPALAAHGVFLVPLVVDRIAEQRQTRNSNSTIWTIHLLVEFRFHAADGSWVSALTWGEGTDAGDKATSKAHTMALKAALRQVFCIAEGGPDPDTQTTEESTPPPPPRETLAADDRAALEAQIAALPEKAQARLKTIWATEQKAKRLHGLKGLAPDEVPAVLVLLARAEAEAEEGDDPPAAEPETGTEAPEKPAGDDPAPAPPVDPAKAESCEHDFWETDDGTTACTICGAVV